LILPFFATFELYPEYGSMLLRWREIGSDKVFDASHASDGMLRAMALVALLQQPDRDLPNVLIIDEPELGLHPYAIEVLAGLIYSASRHAQLIVATQSVSLIDRLVPARFSRHTRESGRPGPLTPSRRHLDPRSRIARAGATRKRRRESSV
jgi:predicted ATPase